MRYLFPAILFADFILATYFTITLLKREGLKHRENQLFLILCFSSGIWSFGFAGVFLQTIPERAYIWRAIGMSGTFLYLISAQLFMSYLSGLKTRYRTYIDSFSLLGIIIYFFVIQKEQATYTPSSMGMTYSLTSGFWNNVYTAYTVLVAIHLFYVSIHMIRFSKTKRVKALGKRLFTAEMIIIVGMIFDTILPLIGMNAIPGSSISQFLGVLVIYSTILFIGQSRITTNNMSEFIYHSLKVPVLIYDSNLKLQILNDQAFSFLEINDEDYDITGIDTLFEAELEDIFTFSEQSHDVDAICCHNNSYCSLSVNKIQDKFNDIIGYIIIVTDLSERMKSMHKLEEAKREAEYANQTKSIFLANMSHEIRTPMNAIIGFSELVLKMNISDEVRNHIEDIKWSSHNLLAIINDILDISKIESGKMELVYDNYYTSHFLNDLSIVIAPHAKQKGLEFNVKVDKNIPKKLYGDKIRLRSVIINILNNAVKYTNQGSVTFEVNIISQTDSSINLEFRVSDTGIGIHKDNIDKIFKNFERFDQKIHYNVEGSGLGLAIANGYIKLMNGNIDVISAYGKGSTFVITLEQGIVDSTPIGEDFSKERRMQNSASISNLKIYNIPVLVVDDNPVNLRVAEGILGYYGLDVDTANNGYDAIELCKTKDYTMIFMDQMMPEMNGIEAMTEIRKLKEHYAPGGKSHIIVLTADAIKGTRKHLIELGFDEYLGKPINITQLERLFIKFVPNENISYEEITSQTVSDDRDDIDYMVNILTDVDIQNGLNNCGGKIDDYLKILKITYNYGEKQINELIDLWNSKDYDNYTIKIHALKSTLMNIGASDTSDKAKKQEESGKSGEYSYIDANINIFIAEYKELLSHIKIVLEHFNMLELNTSTQIDERILHSTLHNINKCIDDFDFAQIFDILEKVKAYEIDDNYRTLFDEIEKLMDDLAVDEIKELINNKFREN